MKRHRLAWVLVMLFLAGASGVVAQAPERLKIGVYDPQRVSEETEEGKKVQTELTALRDKKLSEIGAKEKDLTDLQNQLTTKGLSLSPEKRDGLEKEIQRKALDLNQAREAARSEMQFELSAAQSRFNDKLLLVVERFGRDEGFTIVLDRNVAAYVTPSIDVTTAIVDLFNQTMRPAAEKEQKEDKKEQKEDKEEKGKSGASSPPGGGDRR